MSDFTMKITAGSFVGLKSCAAHLARRIEGARNYKEIPCGGGGSGGPGSSSVSFSIAIEAPVEVRIAALRAEANQLERGLIEGSSVETSVCAHPREG